MLKKSVLQDLQDSQLIKIFLNFVQSYRLQYQKIHKEISYKFYEATWMLNVGKATGYGRTETQAYKSGLKNLLQLLIDDPRYDDYFSKSIVKFAKKKQEDSLQSTFKIQLKTEGDDFSCKSNQKNHHEGNDRMKTQSSKKSFYTITSQKENSELQQARSKMKLLQAKLALVLEENRILKSKLNSNEPPRRSLTKINSKDVKIEIKDTGMKASHSNQALLRERSDGSLLKKCNQMTSKLNIPKLNLNVLPNYQKKSEKCLNDALLEAYNQKHGNTGKIIL